MITTRVAPTDTGAQHPLCLLTPPSADIITHMCLSLFPCSGPTCLHPHSPCCSWHGSRLHYLVHCTLLGQQLTLLRGSSWRHCPVGPPLQRVMLWKVEARWVWMFQGMVGGCVGVCAAATVPDCRLHCRCWRHTITQTRWLTVLG
jgi:hypothetical protein